MTENNTRCNYCGRTLYKQVSEKYFVCSQKCKRLIKNNTYIETVDSLVLRVNSTKWSKVDDLNKKVDVNKLIEWFILNYPKSSRELKKDPSLQFKII